MPTSRDLEPGPQTPPKGAAEPRPTSPTLPGTVDGVANVAAARFGKFVRTDRIGAGGMGEVWRGWDTELGRWVALKFLKADDPGELERFRREAQTAARLTHPHIAAIYEVGFANDRHYIAMQFVRGRTLRELRKSNPRYLASLVRDAARAVHYAHERGIIHRDIKPENLMLQDGGSDGAGPAHVFVVDFGLARPANVASDLSASGIIRGTPAYMAPEQARGEILDARTDVYAFGATLYELLVGRPPFDGKSSLDVLRKIEDQEPRPPRSLVPTLDQDLQTIVLTCLEKDRRRRYATAAALAEDLTKWLDGETISARPASFLDRMGRLARRRKAAVGLVTALVVLAAGAAILLPQLARARRDAADSERRLREASIYLPLENELNLLRMKCYRPDFKFDDAEFARYSTLESQIHRQMGVSTPSAEGWYLIGRCREVQALDAAADQAYEQALNVAPDHAASLLARGRLRIEGLLVERYSSGTTAAQIDYAGRAATEAVDWIRKGCAAPGAKDRLDSDLAESYAKLFEQREFKRLPAHDALRKWKGESFVEEFLVVQALSEGGEAGIAALTEVVRRMPSGARAWMWRGAMQSDSQAGISDFTRALEINPRLAPAWSDRALAYRQLGLLHEALSDLDEALRLDPRSAQALTNRSRIRFDRAEYPGALADLDAAIRINPRLAEAFLNRGAVRKATGDLEGAMADYDESLRLRPDFADAYLNRGNLNRLRRRQEAALADFDEAVKLNPAFVSAWIGRSGVLREQGRADEAFAAMDRAVRVDPKSVDALLGRATLHMDRKDVASAVKDLDEAIRLKPQAPEAWFRRGAARSFPREAEAADADYSEAIRLNPNYADALGNRGALRKARGDVAAARADFRKALEVAPAGWPFRANIERLLAQIPE